MTFRDLLETRTAVLADVRCGPSDRLLVHSDLTGTRQLYELTADGELRQLTDLAEPVGPACYVPGRSVAAIEIDRGGNERHQIYLIDLETPKPVRDLEELAALTNDARFGHHLAGVSPDGAQLAYLSNRRNSVDFDLWVTSLDARRDTTTSAASPTGPTGDEHRLVYDGGGWCQEASGFSPDGRFVSILRPGPRPLDDDLLLVEVATGKTHVVLEHPDEAAQVGAPAWADDGSFYVASNVGSDQAVVLRYDVATSTAEPVPPGTAFDAFPVTSGDGTTLLVVENRDGQSHLVLHDSATGACLGEVPLPEPGVVQGVRLPGPVLSEDGGRVYYTLSSPRLAGDVWCFHRATGETRRLTTSPTAIDPASLASAERHELESFDGERVPLFLFQPQPRPTGDGRPAPVVVVVHGGPEGQSTLAFNPVVQGLAAGGFAVVVPNVRGSTGYGKRYAALDDTTKRLDSVRDLAAVHRWLATAGLDADRAVLWGGSYGGYMVLAGVAFQPELWAAGVDIVGISDLVTFLTNTSDYRRAHRELEYGSLERDREFLEQASPMRRAEQIRAPLFVIHGRNDPRVPVSEAEQLAKTLLSRGVRCELVIYEDEGHGLARLANRLDAYPRAVAFLDEVLARD
jgi:dipeptidyl aminopeptidase/acylaminoacyl peptidase